MREIKFRGKTVHHFDHGRWVYGGVSHNAISWVIHEYRKDMLVNGEYVDPETLCQYIGIHDVNGQQIYEGDVVTYSFPDDDYENEGIVWFNYKKCAFEIFVSIQIGPKLLWTGISFECTSTEVIGNIFDNPDLRDQYRSIWDEEDF